MTLGAVALWVSVSKARFRGGVIIRQGSKIIHVWGEELRPRAPLADRTIETPARRLGRPRSNYRAPRVRAPSPEASCTGLSRGRRGRGAEGKGWGGVGRGREGEGWGLAVVAVVDQSLGSTNPQRRPIASLSSTQEKEKLKMD